MCRINRELSIAIPSFGDTRMYHVVIEFNPGAETISTKVTDNLHEKTYYVCHGMVAQVGMFNSMDRLILVAEPAEGAYIEGSMDNIVLSVPATLNNNATPVADMALVSQNSSPSENVPDSRVTAKHYYHSGNFCTNHSSYYCRHRHIHRSSLSE